MEITYTVSDDQIIKRKLFKLYPTTKTSSHQLQLLVKLRMKVVYLFNVLLTANITC